MLIKAVVCLSYFLLYSCCRARSKHICLTQASGFVFGLSTLWLQTLCEQLALPLLALMDFCKQQKDVFPSVLLAAAFTVIEKCSVFQRTKGYDSAMQQAGGEGWKAAEHS